MTSNSHFLGKFNGKTYRVIQRPDPGLTNEKAKIEDFCITLECRTEKHSEEVVTIDTAHGYVHIDLKFQEHPFKDDKIPLEHLGYWDAYKKIIENWESYARKHEKKKGRL